MFTSTKVFSLLRITSATAPQLKQCSKILNNSSSLIFLKITCLSVAGIKDDSLHILLPSAYVIKVYSARDGCFLFVDQFFKLSSAFKIFKTSLMLLAHEF